MTKTQTVKLVKKLRGQGVTYNEIGTRLLKRGVTTRTGKKIGIATLASWSKGVKPVKAKAAGNKLVGHHTIELTAVQADSAAQVLATQYARKLRGLRMLANATGLPAEERLNLVRVVLD